MRVFLAWVSANEAFDPAKHQTDCGSIVDLSIVQAEGKSAEAWATFSKPPAVTGQQILISTHAQDGPVLLFRGRMEPKARSATDQTVTMLFRAEPEPTKAQRLLQTLLKTLPTDPLFKKDPHDALSNTRGALYWDRVTHELKISDAFNGVFKNIGNRHVAGRLRLGSEPLLKTVHVSLEAQWIQHFGGARSLKEQILAQFRHGVLNTYTDAKPVWPAPFQPLGNARSVYILESSLEEKKPGLGFGNRFYQTRNAFWPRKWFDFELSLGWDVLQKRVETVTFSLANKLQTDACAEQTLAFRLNPVQKTADAGLWRPDTDYDRGDWVRVNGKLYQALKDHTSSDVFGVFEENEKKARLWRYEEEALPTMHAGSFFTTDRGRLAVEEAVQRAVHRLAFGSRRSVSFVGSVQDLYWVTTDHTVRLDTETLGTLQGKVTAYEIVFGVNARVEVTVAVPFGTGEEPPVLFEKLLTTVVEESYAESDVFESDASGKTPSGVLYRLPVVPHEVLFSVPDPVPKVRVSPSPEAQEEALREKRSPGPLRLSVSVDPYKTPAKESVVLAAEVSEFWSAPNGFAGV